MFKRSWFWDRLAKRYARMPIANQAFYETKLEKTRAFLRADSRVLEFGCGTGSTALLHAPHVALIHAIDYSPRMLEIAREKTQASGVSNLTFAQAALTELESPAGSWDVIMGMSSRKTVRRERLMERGAGLPPCLIGMEACGGAHE